LDVQFVSEYVLEDSILFKNTLIGGLSGVDCSNGFYYFAVDDANKLRFLKAKINIDKRKITSINFESVIFLNDSITNFYKENSLDLESIFIDEEKQHINFSSEGGINSGKRPTILQQILKEILFWNINCQKKSIKFRKYKTHWRF
jgi:hypothetical protein